MIDFMGFHNQKVTTGAIYFTPGIRESIPLDIIVESLARHVAGDWGDLCEEDRLANDLALSNGNERILSSYKVNPGCAHGPDKLWIITEADRSSTTMLLPEEY